MALPTYKVSAVLHLCAPNDVNGNPRRLFVFLDGSGQPSSMLGEGFSGLGSWSGPEPVRVNVSASEYRLWLRRGRDMARGL